MASRALAKPQIKEEEPGVVETKPGLGPTEAQIQQRAYEIYVLRGYVDGCDVEDWLQAEAELRAEA